MNGTLFPAHKYQVLNYRNDTLLPSHLSVPNFQRSMNHVPHPQISYSQIPCSIYYSSAANNFPVTGYNSGYDSSQRLNLILIATLMLVSMDLIFVRSPKK